MLFKDLQILTPVRWSRQAATSTKVASCTLTAEISSDYGSGIHYQVIIEIIFKSFLSSKYWETWEKLFKIAPIPANRHYIHIGYLL